MVETKRVDNDVNAMDNISTVFAILYSQISASLQQVALQMGVEHSVVSKLCFLKNEDISTDLLFRLYYLADIVLRTTLPKSLKNRLAVLLKELCDCEIEGRIAIK